MSRPRTDLAQQLRRDRQYLASGLTDADTRALWRVTMLSPTLEVAAALLKGQEVPAGVLDPMWRRRFRL